RGLDQPGQVAGSANRVQAAPREIGRLSAAPTINVWGPAALKPSRLSTNAQAGLSASIAVSRTGLVTLVMAGPFVRSGVAGRWAICTNRRVRYAGASSRPGL